MREEVRQRVAAELGPLLDAQLANARGLKYLVTRDKRTGKFVRVSEALARVKLGQEVIEVWAKDPSFHAFTDLLNRAIDKPAEQPQEIQLSGQLDATAKLKLLEEGRARNAAAKKAKA